MYFTHTLHTAEVLLLFHWTVAEHYLYCFLLTVGHPLTSKIDGNATCPKASAVFWLLLSSTGPGPNPGMLDFTVHSDILRCTLCVIHRCMTHAWVLVRILSVQLEVAVCINILDLLFSVRNPDKALLRM